jgi:hypothetical protein
MKTKHSHSILFIIQFILFGHAYAFDTGDVISFDPGEQGCTLGGVYPNCDLGATGIVTGSYFAMDYTGDGVFDIYERTAISPSQAGGIIAGVLQPAGGSHSGCPDGTESPGPDAPWCFFGNTGMHQTTVTPVIDNGDGTLGFTGWGVTWSGIANIPLGGDPANFPQDTGLATLTCSSTPCTPVDDYSIDYTAHVPIGDPSGFGGIYYQLHLEKITPGPSVSISIDVAGGLQQECSQTGGSVVSMTANTVLSDGDSVQNIEWFIDGQAAASGDMISEFLSLGSHVINASVTTANGLTASAAVNLSVVDTTPPVVSSEFINRFTRMPAAELRRFNFLEVQAEATDTCDATPVVKAMFGANVNDGDYLYIMKYFGNVSLGVTAIDLTVMATDSSNNSSSATTTLNVQ